MENETNNEPGIVYILTNEAMPDLKIGFTTDLSSRLRSLSNSSVPLPFEVFFAKRVGGARNVEQKMHAAFSKDRVNRGAGREFFMLAPEQAAAALSIAEGEEIVLQDDFTITAQEEQAINEVKKMRPWFKFSMVDIKPGTVLVFFMDDSITCTVVDDRTINFRGENISLGRASELIIKEKGYNWKAISGPNSWMYEGETLYQRRIRMESGDEKDE